MKAKATSSVGLLAALGLALIAVDARGDISVTPASYDFGNVEVGTSVSTIITITNVQGEVVEPLVLHLITLLEGSHADFTITDKPPSGTVLQVGESADIVITYSPSSVGITSAVLEIISNDPLQTFVLVPLSGTGVVPLWDAEISPSEYDFGEVVIGTTSTLVVSLTNIGVLPFTFESVAYGAGSEPDFGYADPLFGVLDPGDVSFIELKYSPTSEGLHSAICEVWWVNGTTVIETVTLSGVGVLSEPDPLDEIADLIDFIDFIDISVADGTLWGDGPGNSAANRLNALKNMLEAASDLIEAGDYDQGCQQLWDVYFKVDGESPPPDFVDGPAAAELAIMVLDVIVVLGCG